VLAWPATGQVQKKKKKKKEKDWLGLAGWLRFDPFFFSSSLASRTIASDWAVVMCVL
jgi:hypothetical protein